MAPPREAPRGAGCHHQPQCPGCPRYGHASINPAARVRLEELAARAGCPPPHFGQSSGFGYRHRVRLSVRGAPARPQIGIFQAGTHRLVHIADCPLHHPAIKSLTAELLAKASELEVPTYCEKTHTGLFGAVQLAVERPTGRVQVVLILRVQASADGRLPAAAVALGQALRESPFAQSVWCNFQPERNNTLLGTRFERLWGADAIEDRAPGARVFFPPGAFGQANPSEHDRATLRIHQFIKNEPVLEYYAGVGTIGLGLAARGNRVTFNEVGTDSLRGLTLGLATLPHAQPCQVLRGTAGAHAGALQNTRETGATVVVDPPRKGLDPELLATLVSERPRQLLYLSCNLDSLVRDAETLRVGGFRLSYLEGFPYFPFTEHVETLARFEAP